MLRWLFLLITVVAFAAAFRATTASALGWTLLVGFVAMLVSFFGFLAARVGAVSRGQHSREMALMVTTGAKAAGSKEQVGSVHPEPTTPPMTAGLTKRPPIPRPEGDAD